MKARRQPSPPEARRGRLGTESLDGAPASTQGLRETCSDCRSQRRRLAACFGSVARLGNAGLCPVSPSYGMGRMRLDLGNS